MPRYEQGGNPEQNEQHAGRTRERQRQRQGNEAHASTAESPRKTEVTAQLPRPPKYFFAEGLSWLQRKRLERHAFFDLPPGIEMTPERAAQLGEIIETFTDFAEEELGIDLSQRLKNIKKKFHFYDRETFDTVATKIKGKSSPNLHGFTLGTQDMLIAEEQGAEETLATAHHELMHSISPGFMHQPEGNTPRISTTSYHSGNGTLALDEALREITNVELRYLHWSKNPILAAVNSGKTKYIREIIVVDQLLKKVADARNQPYKDVLRHLQRKMFLGKNDGLQIIKDTVTQEEWRIFTQWIAGDHTDKAIQVAAQLGLSEAVKKLHSYNRGEKAKWFGDFSGKFSFTAQAPKDE